jgi:membrane-associated PAP2 superfamily phosphatase
MSVPNMRGNPLWFRLRMPVSDAPLRLPLPCPEPAIRCESAGVWRRLLLPLAAWSVAMLWARGLNGDFWLADRIYAAGGRAWALHANAWVEQGLHVVGKRVSAAAWLLVVMAWLCSLHRPHLAAWRRPLAYLALSISLATGTVALAKMATAVDCPWDLLRYGGSHAYHGLFDARPAAGHRSCFPAGHASAGYAWVSLYFFFAAARPRWRWAGLCIGLAAGAVFGAAQQVRGAHFLSHDLTTLMICWSIASLLQPAMLAEETPA